MPSAHHNAFQAKFLLPKYWMLWMIFALLWILALLPYVVQMKIGAYLGRLLQPIAKSRAHIVATNLSMCFPDWDDAKRKWILNKNFESMGMAFFEMSISWFWPKRRLLQLFEVEGLHHLQKLQTQDKGVILMAAHFTTLEIGATLLGQVIDIDGMYRKHKNHLFDFLQRWGREKHNIHSIALERNDTRGTIRRLRQGRIVWYAPDQDYGAKHSIFVPWFGIPCAVVTATSKLAQLGHAVIVPFSQTRIDNGKGYRLVIGEPWAHFPSNSIENDCKSISQWVESKVASCPEQYLWAHRRFKTRPPGESDKY